MVEYVPRARHTPWLPWRSRACVLITSSVPYISTGSLVPGEMRDAGPTATPRLCEVVARRADGVAWRPPPVLPRLRLVTCKASAARPAPRSLSSPDASSGLFGHVAQNIVAHFDY